MVGGERIANGRRSRIRHSGALLERHFWLSDQKGWRLDQYLLCFAILLNALNQTIDYEAIFPADHSN
jgi:hypothetical protein